MPEWPEDVEVGRHRLQLDGDWSLIDLSTFGRQYTQIYVRPTQPVDATMAASISAGV